MISRRFRTVALALAWALGAGCSHPVASPYRNQRPVVELTRAPYNETTRFEYRYRMNWIGHDPDGRIDRYLYSIDPPHPTAADPEPDSTWVETLRHEQLLAFTATVPDTVRHGEIGASDFHTFVLKAVDNGGPGGPLQSAPLVRSFFSYTVAPTVQILSPAPSSRGRTYVTPSVRIEWTGEDPDGSLGERKPVQYRFILLDEHSEVPWSIADANPDSVRRYYAPRGWPGWDSTSTDAPFRSYSGLVPGQNYMFVVIAIDEAGAYSPVFNLNQNMLDFRVLLPTVSGPILTVYSDFFYYRYAVPTYSTLDPSHVRTEVAAGVPVTIHWLAETIAGTRLLGTRWVLDAEDLGDDTPRSDEQRDVTHWSRLCANERSATVGPFEGSPVPGGETHFLYIEAVDVFGFKSLAVVRIAVVQCLPEFDLLVVDDTRRQLDQWRAGESRCLTPPGGLWPTAAELDTFLFARGNKPWRCYDPGVLSTPGLFTGYEFDSLGTRFGIRETRVPLGLLGRYRHVVWITDPTGAIADGPGTSLTYGMGALRYMNEVGRTNSIATYIQQGGQVWMLGGGVAYASLIPYNRFNNDIQGTGTTFSNLNGELVPGRFLYDHFRLRSELKVNNGQITFTKCLARHDSAAVALGRPRPVEYGNLPAVMRRKALALGDAPPPFGTVGRSFYATNFDIEYLSQRNDIVEDVDPDPGIVDDRSTLDTLFRGTGATLVGPQQNYANVCMTRYVGDRDSRVIFTGFNIWSFARVDCKNLVDAVLQDMWHLTYNPPPIAADAVAASRDLRSGRRYSLGSSGPPALTGGARAPRER